MNTVQLRTNKPSRYQLGNDGRVRLIEDEAPAAEPLLPSDAAIGEVFRSANDAGFAKRIAELKDVAAKARDTIAAANKAQADLAAREAAFAPAQAAHEQRLAGATLAHEQAMERRLRNVEMAEHAVGKRERDIEKREAALKADRAKLDKKFAALRDAAAD